MDRSSALRKFPEPLAQEPLAFPHAANAEATLGAAQRLLADSHEPRLPQALLGSDRTIAEKASQEARSIMEKTPFFNRLLGDQFIGLIGGGAVPGNPADAVAG